MTTNQAPVLRASTDHQIVSRRRRKVFLRIYSITGNKVYAAQSAGWPDCKQVNRLLRQDPEFKRAFEEAQEAAADALEAEVIRRGKDGILKPVFHKGEVVGHQIEYSDPLLILAMKAAKPEKYSEKSQREIKHTGVVGVALLPTKFTSVEDWEKQNSTGQPLQIETPSAVDAEFTDVNSAEETENDLDEELAKL